VTWRQESVSLTHLPHLEVEFNSTHLGIPFVHILPPHLYPNGNIPITPDTIPQHHHSATFLPHSGLAIYLLPNAPLQTTPGAHQQYLRLMSLHLHFGSVDQDPPSHLEKQDSVISQSQSARHLIKPLLGRCYVLKPNLHAIKIV
jgi:hypothetical protein